MAQPYVTGPCALWVGVGAGRAPVFLGHSEVGFTIEERPEWEPVICDLAGTKIPFDIQDMGEDAVVHGTLTRWNEPVFNKLLAHPRSGGTPGRNISGDRGFLMQQEGGAVPIWLVFPYVAKPAMAAGGMPPGRRYPFAVVQQKSMAPCGSKALKRLVVFHCLPAFNVATGSFTLYDTNMTGTNFSIN
jgi:hypothetical protein